MPIGIVLDNFSPHLSTNDDPRISIWAAANNVELAYTPTNASWLNRIEAQFRGRRVDAAVAGVGGKSSQRTGGSYAVPHT